MVFSYRAYCPFSALVGKHREHFQVERELHSEKKGNIYPPAAAASQKGIKEKRGSQTRLTIAQTAL
jgi:hypothetical protein